MSIDNIRLIQELNRIDPDQGDYNYILSKIRQALDKARIYISPTRETNLYFRAVIWNTEKPKKVDKLKAPPADKLEGFQRCNPPKTPMFYCASKRITALLECDVQEGDMVYLSQWINKSPVPINRILYPGKYISHLWNTHQ